MSDTGDVQKTNGLVCFTNCLLPQEDGKLVERDLWVDEQRGVILDAQKTFFIRKERPDTVIDLGGNILSPGLIDIQINGAYNFDFSVYEGDDEAYLAGLDMVARRIVETGVTSLLPTIITQSSNLYPSLLRLLKPYTPAPDSRTGSAGGATMLGWHAEGPFLQPLKRGAHSNSLLRSAPDGWEDVQNVYGDSNLALNEDWQMQSEGGVRMVTIAPEVEGMMDVVAEMDRRGVVVSIGHSVASSDIATRALRKGARLITHLFNAMPQLHHRDPGIIGLIGASPASSPALAPVVVKRDSTGSVGATGASSPATPSSPAFRAFTGHPIGVSRSKSGAIASEAMDDFETPPQTPMFRAFPSGFKTAHSRVTSLCEPSKLDLNETTVPLSSSLKEKVALKEVSTGSSSNLKDERPYYGIIVDGVHSHPNSVRLAYMAHQDGCILITDAMKILDPNMADGPHAWREDGPRFVKEGSRLYVEGHPETLAGSVITLDACVRNFVRFTGCSIGEALRCATYNPAKCLGIETRKGTLRAGADADLVVMDKQGNVLNTWVRGRKVWSKA